jgi:hypothetical protein
LSIGSHDLPPHAIGDTLGHGHLSSVTTTHYNPGIVQR